MRHSFRYEEFGSVLTLCGEFDVSAIKRLHEQMYDHPNLDEMTYFIIDGSAACVSEESRLVPMIIPAMDKVFASYKKNLKVLCVSRSPELLSLFKQYKAGLADTDWDVRIFSDLYEARNYQREHIDQPRTSFSVSGKFGFLCAPLKTV